MSNGSTTWTYTYNADGLRTSRSNGTTTYSYVYNGSSLSQMTVGSNTLYFAYDANGSPMSVAYNGTNYYYVTNIQGDVIAVLDSSGTKVVEYSYDAWGKLLSTSGTMSSTLGTHNPLRYRSYVYDHETGLYYLQSRYYDPKMGRFINADSYPSTGQGILGNNMFTYCLNNPIMHFDQGGEFGWFTIANAVIGAVIGAVSQVATNYLSGNEDILEGVAGAALGGAVYNVVGLATGNLALASLAGSAVEATTNEAMGYLTGKKEFTKNNVAESVANAITTTGANLVAVAVTGKIASNIVKTNSGWFKPQKFSSSFVGKYAQKIWGQTAVQAGMMSTYNTFKNHISAAYD